MKMQKLHELLVEELRELFDGEQQFMNALPQMAAAASSPRLRAAFQTHLHETQEQLGRLDEIFEQLGETPTAHASEAMKGLVKETDKIAANMDDCPLRDAGLIGAAGRIKRYAITAFGTALTFAEILGYRQVALLLDQIIQHEKQADRKLTQLELSELAEQMIWESALEGRQQAVA